VRAPLRVPIPGWGTFPELNVRAYVRTDDGHDGIWFLGMVVPRLSFVAAAGSLGLPYQRSASSMSVDVSRWQHRFGTPHPWRLRDDVWFQASVTVGEPLLDAAGRECDRPMDGVSSACRGPVGDTGVPRAVAAAHRHNYR